MVETKKYALLCSLLLMTTFAVPVQRVYSYVGGFRFPGITDEKKFPTVPVYYKGAVVDVEENGYVLTDSKKYSDFLIVISLLQTPTANTIARFEIPYKQKYLLCNLHRKATSKRTSKEIFEETWDIIHTIEEGPFFVPEESLVILMDPTCIDTISFPIWSKEGSLIKLPTFTFKKDTTCNSAFNRSLLASLDIAPFHKKDEVISCSTKKSTSSIRKS